MRFCPDHWTKLRAAVDARGLGVLVSESGEEAARKMFDRANGADLTIDNFDPLMEAHYAIVGNVYALVGPALFSADGGQLCPLCHVVAEHAEVCTTPGCTADFEQWIDCAADDVLASWQRLKP